jgi:cytochrome P450
MLAMTTSQSLGAAYDPLGAHLQDPYEFYALARREGPVFFSSELHAWVVTRYDDVLDVLRHPEEFSSRNALPRVYPPAPATLEVLRQGYPPAPSVTDSDGELHARLRAALAPMFTAEQIRRLEPFIREQATELLDAFAGDGRVEFRARYADPLPRRVIMRLCGIDSADEDPVAQGTEGLVAFAATPLSPERQAAAASHFVALQHLAGSYVRTRRAEPQEDLTSRMVQALVPGTEPLTFEQETQAVSNLMEILIAGQITTGPLLAGGLWHLLAHPDQWERLCAQPALLPQAVEEICRYDAAASGMCRQTTREVTLGGAQIPADATIVLRFNAANRDPACVDEPDRFEVTRPPARHLTFGFGLHYCLGAGLARTELAVTLELLTRRLPGLRLDDSRPVAVRAVQHLRGPDTLQLSW